MNNRLGRVDKPAPAIIIKEVTMRQIEINDPEYTTIHSVYPPPQIIYVPVESRRGLGFFGWLGVFVVVFCLYGITQCHAQSSINQYYGWQGYRGYNGPNSYPTPTQRNYYPPQGSYSGAPTYYCHQAGSVVYCSGTDGSSYRCSQIGANITCQ